MKHGLLNMFGYGLKIDEKESLRPINGTLTLDEKRLFAAVSVAITDRLTHTTTSKTDYE